MDGGLACLYGAYFQWGSILFHFTALSWRGNQGTVGRAMKLGHV